MNGHVDPDAPRTLRRWELSGGHWRVLSRTDEAVTVGLFTCDGGEEMGRVTGPDPEIGEFLAGRDRSDA